MSISAALALLCFSALAAPPVKQTRGSAPAAGTIVVEKCKLFWEDERFISSRITGRIEEMLVSEGDLVEKDDVLATLDDREARLDLALQTIVADSDLDERNQVEKLNEYRARLDAAERLFKTRAISEEDYRLAVVNVKVNEILALKEKEKRKIEQVKKEKAEELLNDHVIKSPMRGIIQKRNKRQGESLSPNDLQLFRIVATDQVWVEGLVSIKDLFQVRVGQRVDVQLTLQSEFDPLGITRSPSSAPLSTKSESGAATEKRAKLPQEEILFPGTIVFIDPEVEYTNKAAKVRALVENRDDILRAGFLAKMTIYTDDAATASAGRQAN
jgi:RND family efflux transporter MFP subunit